MQLRSLFAAAVCVVTASLTAGVASAGALIEQSNPQTAIPNGTSSSSSVVKVWLDAGSVRSLLPAAPLQKASSTNSVTPDKVKPTGSKAGTFLKHLALGMAAATGHPAGELAAQAGAMAEAKAQQNSVNPTIAMNATWALEGETAPNLISERRPAFEVAYAAQPQIAGTALTPVVIKLSAGDQGRSAGSTELHFDKTHTSTPLLTFSENRLPSHVQKTGKNKLKLILDRDLDPGQYAVVFRPDASNLTLDAITLSQMMGESASPQPWQIAWQFAVK